jgi:hypothetical protein
MPLVSFAQLFAQHLFGTPLPARTDCWCRECGGPIEQEMAVQKEYGTSWVDEGIIPYTGSPFVCPSCIELSRGSTTRSIVLPPQGSVLIASPSIVHPKPGPWLRAFTKNDKSVKKEEVYPESISLIEFLENILPRIEVPFGIIYSEQQGGKNRKHFLRYVPVNYDKHNIDIYVMPTFTYASIQPDRFLAAYYDSIELVNLAPAKLREAFKAEKHDLDITEARMLYRYLYTLKNKTKEDDIDEE